MSQRIDYEHVSPAGVKVLGGVFMYVAKSGLEKPLIDLVFLRVSQINGCSYCVDAHSSDLLRENYPQRKLLLVSAWHEAGDMFTPRERAALQWAESLTLIASTHVPDADFATVRAELSEKEIVDLTIGVGLINTYNRIAVGFRRGPAPAPQAETLSA